jgi:hypothetical protein
MPNKTSLLTTAFIAVLVLMGGIELADGHHPTAYITVRPVNTGQTYVRRFFHSPIIPISNRSSDLLNGVEIAPSSKP